MLNLIHGISISASGYSSESPTSYGAPSAVLLAIDSGKDAVTFSMQIDIPVLCVSGTYDVSNSVTINDITVIVSHSIPTGIGYIDIGADVLLKSFNISTFRRISLFGGAPSRKLHLNNGYNTSVTVKGDTLYITGGSGLGIGMYDGSVDDRVKHHYCGIKSINGVRSSRNVNIGVSDLLHENGAYIQ